MSNIMDKGMKWGKRALALKLGKSAIRRGGVVGVGIGAVVGAGYLAYNFFENRKRRENLKPVEDISQNNRDAAGQKQIVV
ncbi:hypothetical protein FK178_14140 [Antarcticibacterium arcticum]|uniref:Uncharacterized protein n=1 Tax=Antarcticibacterium arcticum TaxID=2585771 RepID=A0A5B8YQR4_9FLAO|nr:hypothetical protein [Antarcticibacterium arcticum]QED38786.1 hypothetical protein FK178_14140 [Antarcticibacterium arcticum]